MTAISLDCALHCCKTNANLKYRNIVYVMCIQILQNEFTSCSACTKHFADKISIVFSALVCVKSSRLIFIETFNHCV